MIGQFLSKYLVEQLYFAGVISYTHDLSLNDILRMIHYDIFIGLLSAKKLNPLKSAGLVCI